jgi:glycosyltransferase involved in cell wall biosynthesis
MQAPLIAEVLYSYRIGGSERLGANLALEFRRRGYRVLCFAVHDSEGPVRVELEAGGVRCLDLNYLCRPRLLRRYSYRREVYRMLAREGVAALHLHHVTSLILCAAAARRAGVPQIVMTEHALHQLRAEPATRARTRRLVPSVDAVTVVAPEQLAYFRDELGVAAARLACIPNGIQVPARTPATIAAARAALGLEADAFAFCYAGRLVPIKQLEVLVDAFARLPQPIRARSTLCLVGDGESRAALETAARLRGVADRVSFAGARTGVAALLLGADAFVMSSSSEGLPMAMLEAMAAGVPCVSTAVGGIPELLRAGAGLLVPPGDAAALAAAMASLVEQPALGAALAAAAFERVRTEFPFDGMVNAYLARLGLPPRWSPAGR